MERGISLFVPLLDEEEILEVNAVRLREAVRSLGRPFEIHLVSNGSTDRTERIGKDLASRHAEIRFAHLPLRGIGRALRETLDGIRFDRVLLIDIDLTIDLAFLAEADRSLETHAVVLGSKRAGYEKRPRLRRFGSAFYHFAAERLTGLTFQDYSPGAKGFRTNFLLRHRGLIDDMTGFVLPLAAVAVREGAGVAEIGVRCEDFRKSRFSLMNEGIYRFAHLARFWWGRGVTRGDSR